MEAHSSQSPSSQLAWHSQDSHRHGRKPPLSTANASISISFAPGYDRQDMDCGTREAIGQLLLDLRLVYLSLGRDQEPLQLRLAHATSRFDEGDPFAAALAALGEI